MESISKTDYFEIFLRFGFLAYFLCRRWLSGSFESLAVLLWLMAGYFYLNAAFCMMKGLDDPTGAFVGGAVLSLVMALLFSFMATKT